jgi:glycosyltransferase involved in cell wall biosynthesis
MIKMNSTGHWRTVSIVIPVYCNEKSIKRLFDELRSLESNLLTEEMLMELIFIDDGSNDSSMSLLREIKAQRNSTKIISLARNFGAINAAKYGLSVAQGDCACLLSADLQDPPGLILKMVRQWIDGEAFVICERKERHDPLLSRIFSSVYYILLKTYLIPDFPRGGFDMVLMDRNMLPYILSSTKDVFIPVIAYWLGYKPFIIPYKRQERQGGQSKWTTTKKLKAFSTVFLSFTFLPVRLISLLSILVCIICLLYSFILAFNALTSGAIVPGFATLVFLISFMGLITTALISIIAEYIWRIYGVIANKPDVVVKEIL